jgi:predicted permease
VNPAAGRLLSPADDQRGCPALAVLSYGFWRERFGESPNAIGSTLSLNKHPFQVIGVSAEGFTGLEVGSKFDVAVPICAAAFFDEKESRLERRDWWWLDIGGRVRPDMSPQQLKARLGVLAPQVFSSAAPADWPPVDQQRFSKLLLLSAPLASGTSLVRLEFGQPLTVLMAVVGSVLLIACANLASLMFARASSRRREIAVRTALGASRARLIRQLMTESLLLSLGGGLLGIVLARWGAALLVRYISTGHNKIFLDVSPDSQVVGFTAGIALLTGVLSSVFPALRSTRVSLTGAIKSGQGESEHRVRIRPGKWIVASQVALSLVLVVVAGLFLRSLVKLVTLDIGFDPSHVLLVNANLKTAGVPLEQHAVIFDEIESRLRALPGVIAVGRSLRVPVTSAEWTQTAQVDSSNPPKGDDAIVYFNSISPGYFQTLRTPLLAGRNFTTNDTKTSVLVAVINETFARKFFPGGNPLGQSFRKSQGNKPGPPIQIVGLVRDSKYESLREGSYSQAFLPASQVGDSQADNFEVRTRMLPSTLVPAVQNAVASVNSDVSLDFRSLEEQVGDSLVQERLLATLSVFFGALALLLAMIGLYGVLSYLVTLRQSEFGVRMALGAPAQSILRLVMRDVAVIVLGGTAAGIAISLVTVQLLQKLLFGLGARDAVTMLGAVAVLIIVALVAGYIPARRAMKVDPMVALRYE